MMPAPDLMRWFATPDRQAYHSEMVIRLPIFVAGLETPSSRRTRGVKEGFVPTRRSPISAILCKVRCRVSRGNIKPCVGTARRIDDEVRKRHVKWFDRLVVISDDGKQLLNQREV